MRSEQSERSQRKLSELAESSEALVRRGAAEYPLCGKFVVTERDDQRKARLGHGQRADGYGA